MIINISKESGRPIYIQVAESFEDAIRKGEFKEGELLPSLNELAAMAGIGKDTANKAYSLLLKNRLIDARHGKGFFVSDRSGSRIRVLLIVDKMSSHQQRMIDAFTKKLKDNAEVTLLMHNQDLDLLETYINSNLGNFDYYTIVPHFKAGKANLQRLVSALRRVPEKKLVLMDHIPNGFNGNFGAVYQDIGADIPKALSQGREVLSRYRRMRVVRMSPGIYQDITWSAVKSYCDSIGLESKMDKVIPKDITAGDVFLLTGSRLDFTLVELSRNISECGFELGRDVGLICQNDFVINEIVLGGLTTISSDYAKIGSDAAEMILRGDLRKIHCECSLVRRNTF